VAAQIKTYFKNQLHHAISAAIFSTSLRVWAPRISSLTLADNTVQQETREQVNIAAGNLVLKPLTGHCGNVITLSLSFASTGLKDLKTKRFWQFLSALLIDALLRRYRSYHDGGTKERHLTANGSEQLHPWSGLARFCRANFD